MKGKDIIRETAKIHGVSVQEVRRELIIAMNEAMNSPDPAAREFWAEYTGKGSRLSPEKFVEILSERACKAMEKGTS